MKNLILPLLALLVLSSCSSDDDNAPQIVEPLVITKADYENNYSPGGETFTFFATTPSNVSIPVPGEDQTWDFSELDELASGVFGGSDFTVPSDPAFPSATYAEKITSGYAISGAESNDYEGFSFIELNDNGIFELGIGQNEPAVLNIESIGAVLTYGVQSRPYTGTTKLPNVLLPAEVGNPAVTTNGVIDVVNFTADAPAFNLNSTPGQIEYTLDDTQEVIGSGTANFKGIGEKRVLIIKTDRTTTINYFLGGAPAPEALLNLLGVTNGEVFTRTTYRFVAEDLGTSGFIEVNESGTITNARFRKQ